MKINYVVKLKLHTIRKIKEQLRLNNTILMSTIDQRFSAFQTVILQTVNDLVHSLVISTKKIIQTYLHQIHPSLTTNQTPNQSKINPVIFIHHQ